MEKAFYNQIMKMFQESNERMRLIKENQTDESVLKLAQKEFDMQIKLLALITKPGKQEDIRVVNEKED